MQNGDAGFLVLTKKLIARNFIQNANSPDISRPGGFFLTLEHKKRGQTNGCFCPNSNTLKP